MAECTYRAIYEHDPTDDAWLVRIDGIDGCHTYGRTKQEAAERIEEALALWLDREPGEFALEHQ
jgi:predicted RNase H-like HicB family nuclease